MRIRTTREEFLFFCGFLPFLFVFGSIKFLGDMWWIGLMLAFFPPMVLYLKSKKIE